MTFWSPYGHEFVRVAPACRASMSAMLRLMSPRHSIWRGAAMCGKSR